MNAAHAAKQDVLVEFTARRGCFVNGKYSKSKACKAPSAERLQGGGQGASARQFPYVKIFAPWNEVNHVSQPTYKSPKLAARYYDVLRKTRVQEVHGHGGRRARPEQRRELPAHVPEGLEGQRPDLGPAQLQGRQPQAVQGHHGACSQTVPGRALADRDRRHRAVRGSGFKNSPSRAANGDEVHVPARRARLQARRATVEDHAALRLPLVRRAAARALRRRPREPERRAAPGARRSSRRASRAPR